MYEVKRCRKANAQGKAVPVHTTNHLHAPAVYTNGVKGQRYPPNMRVDGSYNRLNTVNYDGEAERRLVVSSAYFPYDSKVPPPSRGYEELLHYCEEVNL
jgi:hypothetical protein